MWDRSWCCRHDSAFVSGRLSCSTPIPSCNSFGGDCVPQLLHLWVCTVTTVRTSHLGSHSRNNSHCLQVVRQRLVMKRMWTFSLQGPGHVQLQSVALLHPLGRIPLNGKAPMRPLSYSHHRELPQPTLIKMVTGVDDKFSAPWMKGCACNMLLLTKPCFGTWNEPFFFCLETSFQLVWTPVLYTAVTILLIVRTTLLVYFV